MTAQDTRVVWVSSILLWLAGNALRLTILAVPPVIALARDDFGLNATQVGLLSGIPPAFFAVAALAGSLLVARLGLMRALVGGLVVIAIGGGLRGASPNYTTLLAATIVMSIGVAIVQPIMPSAVREWLPQRIALGTAVYSNGLLVGEVLPVWLTIPLVLPAVGGAWRAAIAAWSIPVVLIAIAVALFAPRATDSIAGVERSAKWQPDWHRGLVWRLGALILGIGSMYFATNAFLPIYLRSAGRDDLISGALTALNVGQLPASFLLLVVAKRVERRAWIYVASGALSLACIVGLVFMVGPWTVVWAALLGFSDAAAFILALTLPPLLCRGEDVARTSAGTFTLSYGGTVLVAILSGAVWDVTGMPAMAFIPIAACALLLVAMAAWMRCTGELT